MNQSITSVSNRVSNVETNLGSGSYSASNGHTHSQYLTSHQDLSSITNRISTLEGNFNTALTSLYNACVEKDSTPSSRTISAIVTAVQNISAGSGLEGYCIYDIKDSVIKNQITLLTITDKNSYYVGSCNVRNPDSGSGIIIPESYNEKELRIL